MTTLRAYFSEPPSPDQHAAWCLLDDNLHVVREGSDLPRRWPEADVREGVLAASCGRVAVLSLPPLPPARVAGAARYALDDRLATPADESHVAVGAQGADGQVRLVVVDDAWMRAFVAASARCGIRWNRVLLESDLAAPLPGSWRWCAPALIEPGFVRTAEGSTIAVGAAEERALPVELAQALDSAGTRKPKAIRVDAQGVTPEDCARWRLATGIDFAAGPPWSWMREPSRVAIDLLTGRYGESPARPRADLALLLRPAAALLLCALAIAALAAGGEWLWLRWQVARGERDFVAIARSAAPDQEGVAAPLAIGRRYAELRHRAGLAVDADFLPLLARAAPALATVPAGVLRSVSYADNHLLLELQKLDAAQSAALQQALQRSGVVAIAAATPTGSRMRIGID